jgi:hypothetical protein
MALSGITFLCPVPEHIKFGAQVWIFSENPAWALGYV